MIANTNIAFKEWAVVVDALGQGEQTIILRKGGIHDPGAQIAIDHGSFWLFPTQFHETERSIIPSKRPALREIAANASASTVDIQYFATVDGQWRITDFSAVKQLQGRHIWNEQTLRERFEFGRQAGLHALLVRVYRRPASETFSMQASYGGCKSWVELERSLSTEGLTPVLPYAEYSAQREQIVELLSDHAIAHS